MPNLLECPHRWWQPTKGVANCANSAKCQYPCGLARGVGDNEGCGLCEVR